MVIIDRPGTFRGVIAEHGVSETKNGFPQFIARLQATEYFDETAGEYVPWSEYGQEIIAYLILYTKDIKTQEWVELLNAKQLKTVLGWDGISFNTLADGNYGDKLILFRVEENDFNGKTSLQVRWIDQADANPTRQLQKFDTAKLKGLDSKFAGVLGKAAPTPAKAPAKAPTKAPATPGVVEPATSALASTSAVTPPKRSPGRPPKAKPIFPDVAGETAPAPNTTNDAPSPSPSDSVKTMEDAWEAVNKNPLKAVGDDELANIWLETVAAISDDESKLTASDWKTVTNTVISRTSKF